jgi:death-on-curing protein
VVNRPFLDGNNRLGFALAATFLELNGQRLQAGEVDATVRTLALAAGALDDTGYAAWLRSNSVPLP